MNNKGFTLIELIATILLLAVIMSVGTVTVVNIIQNSKQKSYNLLIENIKIGAQGYFEECENKELTNTIISASCPDITTVSETGYIEKYFELKLNDLLTYGFLKSSATTEIDGKEIKIVENPENNKNISNCSIKVTKKINLENYATSYEITQKTDNINFNGETIECPTY